MASAEHENKARLEPHEVTEDPETNEALDECGDSVAVAQRI